MPRSRPYAIRSTSDESRGRALPPGPDELTPSQQARRRRIVLAGLRLLRSKDYEDVQIRDVALAAEVALGTVYRYFASKDHLFAAVLLEWQTEQISDIGSKTAGKAHPDSLTGIVFHSIRSFVEQPNFYKILSLTARTADPAVREIAETMRDRSDEAVKEALGALSDDDRKVVVMLLGAVLESALGTWLKGEISTAQVYAQVGRVIELLHLPSARAPSTRRSGSPKVIAGESKIDSHGRIGTS